MIFLLDCEGNVDFSLYLFSRAVAQFHSFLPLSLNNK